MTSVPRVAVIGGGAWGWNLVKTFHDLGALVAVADPVPDVRRRVQAAFPSVAVRERHRDVLGANVDAVAIATPASTHRAVVEEALAAGKDVFVEKPMALSSRDAEAMAAAADGARRVLMVGHLLLYDGGITTIKQVLDQGRLGTIHSIHQERLKLGRVRREENVLWSFGVHDLAVFLYLLGTTPTRVSATGQAVLQADVEDDVHLYLEFPAGVRAYLHASWLWPETRRRLDIVGSKGMLSYDEVAGVVTLHDRGIRPDLSAREGMNEPIFRKVSEPLAAELRHFLDRIQDRRRPLSDAQQGIQVVRILEQAFPLKVQA